jgi:hypothetical protein
LINFSLPNTPGSAHSIMEISSGNKKQTQQYASTNANQQPEQTIKATQKTSTSTATSGGGGGNASSTSKKASPYDPRMHILTTSNGSPYQSEYYYTKS